nr:helix-turn-helix transcriptional regulator [uncultured Pedobacter sp.]
MQSWFTRMRKEKGILQKQLYSACSISGPTWLKIEEDPTQLKAKDLMIIAPLLDMKADELFREIIQNSNLFKAELLKDETIEKHNSEVVYSIAAAVARSGKTWREFGEIAEAKSHSSVKRNLESWINKSNLILSKIGYKIGIVKQD